MIDLTPRKLLLLDHYADGEEARHFSLRIDKPAAADRAVIPGQFFMLTVPGFGEAPFTYLKLPDQQGRFDALVRRMGALTQALFEQPPGAVLGYRGPFGKGWPLFFCAHRVLVVAGGCGLAPLAGVIDEASRHRLPLQLSVIYGARNSAAQVLGRERERWRKSLRFMETCDEAKPHQRQGSPLDHFDELFAHEGPEAVLCCGPEALMLATAEACVQRGIAAHKIWLSLERRMHCADGLCGHCYLGSEYVCKDGPTYRYDRYLQVQAAGYRTLITQDQRLC
ncbi:FAD/NAD(P)-binding protein [Pseudomonas sp.]|uniref:FAD/NAD(P)-binding protein n=1 Tax=Pseudomonas sp. TaxID=306 RepID=UPI00356386EF